MKMTKIEVQAALSLSLIMGLRMLGLFLVVPLFSLYAMQLEHATPALVGIAVSIYGLTQAIFQIPFGALSDYFNRKLMIALGLLIFVAGCLVAWHAQSIEVMIIGRALQGAGAVGSTILALIADLTTEGQRTKAMAIAGIMIGASFALAFALGPLLQHWFSTKDLFFISIMPAILAMIILLRWVPQTSTQIIPPQKPNATLTFGHIAMDNQLITLYIGIFVLHAIFTATFVVLPIHLFTHYQIPTRNLWVLYLPTLLFASLLTLIVLRFAEKQQRVKSCIRFSIFLLAISELFFACNTYSIAFLYLTLFLFFTSFSVLESFLPSLVSRTAPSQRKGSALGLFSCAQFLGIFSGGIVAGWLYGQFNFSIVYLFCVILAFFWLFLVSFIQPPPDLVTQIIRLQQQKSQWNHLISKFKCIPGMVEVTLSVDEQIAYLKMERGTMQHPDFIRLREQFL